MKSNLFWSKEDKSIRGSFVNLFLTFCLLFIIIYAILFGSDDIVKHITSLQSLIIWFYGISFGLWSGKKVVESVWGPGQTVTTKTADEGDYRMQDAELGRRRPPFGERRQGDQNIIVVQQPEVYDGVNEEPIEAVKK